MFKQWITFVESSVEVKIRHVFRREDGARLATTRLHFEVSVIGHGVGIDGVRRVSDSYSDIGLALHADAVRHQRLLRRWNAIIIRREIDCRSLLRLRIGRQCKGRHNENYPQIRHFSLNIGSSNLIIIKVSSWMQLRISGRVHTWQRDQRELLVKAPAAELFLYRSGLSWINRSTSWVDSLQGKA